MAFYTPICLCGSDCPEELALSLVHYPQLPPSCCALPVITLLDTPSGLLLLSVVSGLLSSYVSSTLVWGSELVVCWGLALSFRPEALKVMNLLEPIEDYLGYYLKKKLGKKELRM